MYIDYSQAINSGLCLNFAFLCFARWRAQKSKDMEKDGILYNFLARKHEASFEQSHDHEFDCFLGLIDFYQGCYISLHTLAFTSAFSIL